MRRQLLVVGLGNDLCGDDAAGLLAARELAALDVTGVRVLEGSGELAGLVDVLGDGEDVVVVDAVQSPGEPGTILEVDADSLALQVVASSHGFGLCEAVAISRALGAAPRSIRVIGITGCRFDVGERPAPAVAAAAKAVAARIAEEAGRCA